MFDLKRCAIRMASNIKITESKRGKVFLKNDLILRGIIRNSDYEEIIRKSILIMNGIKKVEFNYDDLRVIISYDYNRLSEKKVVSWIKLIIEVIVDNYEESKKYIENNNKEALIRLIEPQLKNEVKFIDGR